MEFEDLNPDQNPTLSCIQADLGGQSKNVHQRIAEWRAMVQAGQDPRPYMTAIANAFLGNLRRVYDFLNTNIPELVIVANRLGKTNQDVLDGIATRAATLITFRDAPKSTVNQAKTSVDALAAAFPLPRAASATPFYLSLPLPATW